MLRAWSVAGVLLLSALGLFSTIWMDRIGEDAETMAVAVAVLLAAYPVPVSILVAWQSTFSARVAVSWEEGERAASPPSQAPSRARRQSGRALARSWRRLESFAKTHGVAGLEELGVASVRDASRPPVDLHRGLSVVVGLLEALARSPGIVDEAVVADLRHIQRELAGGAGDGRRFSLVMLGR